jgi:hypothetical protein
LSSKKYGGGGMLSKGKSFERSSGVSILQSAKNVINIGLTRNFQGGNHSITLQAQQ